MSTSSMVPEKAKKSYRSFSVAFGDRPVTSTAYPTPEELILTGKFYKTTKTSHQIIPKLSNKHEDPAHNSSPCTHQALPALPNQRNKQYEQIKMELNGGTSQRRHLLEQSNRKPQNDISDPNFGKGVNWKDFNCFNLLEKTALEEEKSKPTK